MVFGYILFQSFISELDYKVRTNGLLEWEANLLILLSNQMQEGHILICSIQSAKASAEGVSVYRTCICTDVLQCRRIILPKTNYAVQGGLHE